MQSDVSFITQESSSSANLSSKIYIDIEGEVKSPGLYELEEGSRVNDLIEKAGGLSSLADRAWVSKHLNKAQILNDGDKLYIPGKGEVSDKSSVAGSFVSGDGTININTASATELESLPGIGEKTAQKIIDGRPYSRREELRENKIVGAATYEKIVDLIRTL